MKLNLSRRSFLQSGAGLATGGAGGFFAQAREGADWLRPGDRGYSGACIPFNTEIRTKPGLIAICKSPEAVAGAVQYAQSHRLPVAVRSGGHSFVGHSLNSDGVVIDLSALTQQHLEKDTGFYTAGPGVKLRGLYEFMLPRGRILPAGSCGGVGLGGLTMGGGYGLFAREFGLTCDHLESFLMVSGNGEIIDSRNDPDLLWACRGGGNGNFGAVVSMRFRTQPAPPRLTAERFIAYPANEVAMASLLRDWFEIAASLPDPIFCALVINQKQVTVLMTSTRPSTGPAFKGASEGIESLGFDSRGASRVSLAKAVPRYYGRESPLPFRNFSAGYYHGFSDLAPVAEEIVREVRAQPGFIFQINTLGGHIMQGTNSAYPHRAMPFLGEAQTYWKPGDLAHREALLEASERVRILIDGAGITKHYRNYPSLKFQDWEESYYGSGYAKLQQLKRRYDPQNTFRHRQSVGV